MHLDAMRLFCAVVETGSFTRGAARCHISQSAASQQVRSLEVQLGYRLLERLPGAVRPTPAGAAVYQAFRDILQRYGELQQELQNLNQNAAGTVRVATVYSVGLHDLPPYIKRFLQLYPQCRVDVEYHRTDRVYEAVAQGAFDLGIVAFPHETRRLAVAPMGGDELVLIAPPHHPLARLPAVTPAHLSGQRFVAWTRDIPSRKAIDRLLHRHGVEVAVAVELDNVETIKRSVEAELGVSIIPRRSAAREVEAGTLVAIPIAAEGFWRPVGILYRRGKPLSPAAQHLLQLLTGPAPVDGPGPAGDSPGPTGDGPGPAGDCPGPTGDGPGPAGENPAPAGECPGQAGDRASPPGNGPGPVEKRLAPNGQ